jgi:phage minor structural protein
MSETVTVYNRSREKVADLHQAYQVGVEQRLNEVGQASFLLPLDDPHVAYVQLLYYAEIYDGDQRVDLFRITRRSTVRTGSAMYYRYDCEHVLGMLRDDKLAATLAPTVGTAVAINALLALQGTANWVLGTCGFTEAYLYSWKAGTSLLFALLDVPERFKAEYQWTWNTATWPWTVNLIVPPTTPTAYIDYGKNLKGITKVEDATQLATRLYAYGAGAGADQIKISSLAPGGHEYIDAASLATYGIIVKHWTDQRYTTAATLYAAAIAYLAWLSTPPVTYSVDAAELYRLTSESIDRFTLGALIGVKDDDLGIDVQVRIVAITKSGLDEAPGDVRIELANKAGEFVFTGYVEANDLSDVDIGDIPGGMPGALPGTPTGDGIYICHDYFGFFKSGAWRTYVDIIGRLRCEGTNGHLYWDPTGVGSLDIKGNVTITGGSGAANLTDLGDLALLDLVGSGQLADLSVSTAKIQALAVTNAKIASLTVAKLTSGILDGQYIRLANGGYIAQGKTSYVDNNPGFWLGQGDVNALFNIGDAANYLKWTGSGLIVKGTISGTIAADLDMSYHSLYNCDAIRAGIGPDVSTIHVSQNRWVGYNAYSYLDLDSDVYLRANAGLTVDAMGGTLRLKTTGATADLELITTHGYISYPDLTIVSGKSPTDYYVPVKINGSIWYQRLSR